MKNNQIIALNGGKNRKRGGDDNGGTQDETARLIIEGEEFELGSFVLSGESPDHKRLLFTWNASLDEMISFTKVLEVVVNRKVDEAVHDS